MHISSLIPKLMFVQDHNETRWLGHIDAIGNHSQHICLQHGAKADKEALACLYPSVSADFSSHLTSAQDPQESFGSLEVLFFAFFEITLLTVSDMCMLSV